MMPHPCPRMSSLIRPLAGVPACTGFEGPMLLGRGISGASGDTGREIPKRGTAVAHSVHHLPLPFRIQGGHVRAQGDHLAATGEPMVTSLGERDARIGF